MANQNNVICSRCGSNNTTTSKLKQQDGTLQDIILKSEPTFVYDVKTGISDIGNKYLTYEFQLYMCNDCMRQFALVKSMSFRKDDQVFTFDGNKKPEKAN